MRKPIDFSSALAGQLNWTMYVRVFLCYSMYANFWHTSVSCCNAVRLRACQWWGQCFSYGWCDHCNITATLTLLMRSRTQHKIVNARSGWSMSYLQAVSTSHCCIEGLQHSKWTCSLFILDGMAGSSQQTCMSFSAVVVQTSWAAFAVILLHAACWKASWIQHTGIKTIIGPIAPCTLQLVN